MHTWYTVATMANTSDSVTLQSPRADGSGAAFVVYTLAQFDDQRNPVTAALTVAVNSQPTLVSAQVGTYNAATQAFTVDPNGHDVKLQTIAPKPGNISGVNIKVRDGRQNQDGTPVEFAVAVTLVAPPGVPPTIEFTNKQVITLP